jgi:hypothetical protein
MDPKTKQLNGVVRRRVVGLDKDPIPTPETHTNQHHHGLVSVHDRDPAAQRSHPPNVNSSTDHSRRQVPRIGATTYRRKSALVAGGLPNQRLPWLRDQSNPPKTVANQAAVTQTLDGSSESGKERSPYQSCICLLQCVGTRLNRDTATEGNAAIDGSGSGSSSEHSFATAKVAEALSAPTPIRPNETADIIRYESPEPAEIQPSTPEERMTKALGDLESLMDEMSSITEEPPNMINGEGASTASPQSMIPSSFDGPSDGVPGQTMWSEVDLSETALPRGNSEKQLPTIPTRGSSKKVFVNPEAPHQASGRNRDREPTILLKSPDLYPKGGASDAYYRDWAYSDRRGPRTKPDLTRAMELKERPQPKKEVEMSRSVNENGAIQGESRMDSAWTVDDGESPLHRSATAPLPWARPHEVDVEPSTRRAYTEKWQKDQNVNRVNLNPSPPALTFTKDGHISHVRHQPIARKWATGRKRFTAVIACLNTFIIGFQVGIYVSLHRRLKCTILIREGGYGSSDSISTC